MRVLPALAFWTLVAFAVFRWSRIPKAARRGIAWTLLAVGMTCLLAAPFLHGGYSVDISLLIGGPYPYKVETIERSFAGLAAGLGVLLLVLGALAGSSELLPALGSLGTAWALTAGVLLLRVFIEKLGVQPAVANFVGIIWLAAPVGIVFGLEAAAADTGRQLWGRLVAYAYGVRVAVLLLMLLVTHFGLGTHFDNSGVTSFKVFGKTYRVESRSWEQYRNLIVLPQLVLWPIVTIVVGVLSGGIAYLIARRCSTAGRSRP